MPRKPKPVTPPITAPAAQVHTEDSAWHSRPAARRAAQVTAGLFAAGVLYWWFGVHPYVSTDDARVAATLVRVAPEGAGGRVVELDVAEGDTVTAGEVLLRLDPATAQAQLARDSAHATLARRELARAEQMAAQRGVSARALDEARAAAAGADADERLAALALDRCVLRSPFDGVVVQKSTDVGNQLETGQTALTVADLDHAWVAGNVEETEVGLLKPGQPAIVSVDEGGRIHGTVLEVRDATLSTFALLPSDNTSGNFIKLVQRVPVKIALDPHPGRALRVGESVEFKVKVR
jgi:membrane fusion protein (multidrug efflux system)